MSNSLTRVMSSSLMSDPTVLNSWMLWAKSSTFMSSLRALKTTLSQSSTGWIKRRKQFLVSCTEKIACKPTMDSSSKIWELFQTKSSRMSSLSTTWSTLSAFNLKTASQFWSFWTTRTTKSWKALSPCSDKLLKLMMFEHISKKNLTWDQFWTLTKQITWQLRTSSSRVEPLTNYYNNGLH